MEKIVKQTLLYDFYGNLLTNHQKNIYELYYLHDLSLGEISEQEGISRQGIYDLLKRCTKSLNEYEKKLQLVKKYEINKRQVDKIDRIINEILSNSSNISDIIKKVENIKVIIQELLEDV